MQTFLPYPDFEKSIRTLDKKRLNKQIWEAKQLYGALVMRHNSVTRVWRRHPKTDVLRPIATPWYNHPVTKMWHGYAQALLHYHITAAKIAKEKGININEDLLIFPIRSDNILPEWFGWEDFHKAHQSNLIRKDANFYRQHFPNTQENLSYIYPEVVHTNDSGKISSQVFKEP